MLYCKNRYTSNPSKMFVNIPDFYGMAYLLNIYCSLSPWHMEKACSNRSHSGVVVVERAKTFLEFCYAGHASTGRKFLDLMTTLFLFFARMSPAFKICWISSSSFNSCCPLHDFLTSNPSELSRRLHIDRRACGWSRPDI